MALARKSTPLADPPVVAIRLSRRRGYSLLALSIVLTIIGVVTGISMMMGMSTLETSGMH